jgi:transcriptional regulator with XRE-family HTH domain
MNRLAAYLAQSPDSQKAFAIRIGSTQATVSRLCADKMRPSLSLASRIEQETGGAVSATGWIETGASV